MPRKMEPKKCECGCGEMTKGGRFRPGHDAKLHSKQKAAKAGKAPAKKAAKSTAKAKGKSKASR